MLPGDRLDFLLYFPDGQTEGDVHVQALQRDKIGYGSMAPFSPAVSFVFQPAGIEVEGDMVVTIALPDDLESTEHWAEMPPLVLLLGLDPNALELVPVGVGRIDAENHRIVSEGALLLERLDYIAFTTMHANRQAVLQQYADGDLDLRVMIGLLVSE